MKDINQKFQLVFSIDSHSLLGFSASAWIAPFTENDKVKNVSQHIFLNNYEDFELGEPAEFSKILVAIHEMSDDAIIEKFAVKLKGINKLDILMKDPKFGPLIKSFVEKRIDSVLKYATKNKALLCAEIKRGAYVVDHLLGYSTGKIDINTKFTKIANGVNYQLLIKKNERIVDLKSKKLTVVCNSPAWVILDKILYQIDGINGNMLKAFTSKDLVFVPDKLVKDYFKSFVLKLNDSIEIDSEGFDICRYSEISSYEIELIESLFEQNYVLKLSFCYSDLKFDFNQIQTKRKKIDFKPDGQIEIQHYIRDNDAEWEIANKLLELGLNLSTSKTFNLPITVSSDPFLAFEWVRNRLEKYCEMGFKLNPFYIEDQNINLANFKLNSEVYQEKDWFDVKMNVEIDGFSFPFTKLIQHIKNEQKLYELPDGSYFLIPNAWFEKYSALVNIAESHDNGFRLSKAQRSLIEQDEEIPELILIEPETSQFVVPAGLQATLRPYQLAGFQWLAKLYSEGLGACLADDMGLGKTLQSICLLLHIQESKEVALPRSSLQQLDLFSQPTVQKLRALVVLPSSLVFNWVNEIRKFAPSLRVYSHLGTDRYRSEKQLEAFDVVITSYHILVRDIEFISKVEFDAVILDESQQIKNKDSKMFEAVNNLLSPFRLTLSGTPIENSLSDLWSQMQFINPGILGKATVFKKIFQTPIERHNDTFKKEELLKIVKPFILRRTKKSVIPDLPELSEIIHYCEMSETQAEIYEKEKSAVRNMILSAENENFGQQKIQILNSLQRLRQIASHPAMLAEYKDVASGKFDEVSYMLDSAYKSEEPVLIFSSYVKHLDKFCDYAKDNHVIYSRLTGDVAQKQREVEVGRFQDKLAPWFFLSLKAGGVGLNLTAAEYVFLIDPWWNPAPEQQAIARAHRIGQHKNVTAIRFITKDTIEEKIIELQKKKKQLAIDFVQEDEFFFKLSKEDMVDLVI